MFLSLIKNRVFKSTMIYACANFISQAVPFFLLPVLTRYLTPYDYGIVATFQAMLGIGILIVGMGVVDAVVRGYFDREKKDFRFSQYVFNAFFINIVLFIILTLLLVFFKDFISVRFHFPSAWILLVPVLSISMAIPSISVKLWVFQKRPFPYSLFEVSRVILEFLLTIIFVVVLGLNWQGRIMGMAISKVTFLIFGIFLLVKNSFLIFSINFDYIKGILKYGFPVFLHSLGIVVVSNMDRLFLNAMVGVSTAGLYSVGASVAMIIGFIVGAFNLAWSPVLYEKLSNITNEIKIKLVKFTYLYFMTILCLALTLILIAPYFLKIFVGRDFYGATQFIFWIALGYAVLGMYTMVVDYIFYQRKTYFLSIIAIITIILNIIFNYTLIKINGAIGAAQAIFLTFLARFLLVWYVSNKIFPMPWFSFTKCREDRRFNV